MPSSPLTWNEAMSELEFGVYEVKRGKDLTGDLVQKKPRRKAIATMGHSRPARQNQQNEAPSTDLISGTVH
jgi:hypothetical protein